MHGSRPARFAALGAAAFLATAVAIAQPPAEVAGVVFVSRAAIVWAPAAGADTYNIYRGALSNGGPAHCNAFAVGITALQTNDAPPAGDGFFFLVTAESAAGEEGTAGADSGAALRPLLGRCEQVLRNHVLNRTGYGWSEWSRDRLEALGLEGYIAEQLAPTSISEFSNADLQIRLSALGTPADAVDLIQQQVVRAVYSRRQLEQQATAFWSNHFNTDWTKLEQHLRTWFPACDSPGVPPQCDPQFPGHAFREASRMIHAEVQEFRRLAFEGNFRELVEASAQSPAMLVYLDTVASVAGAPNENYPRELLELHTMGVDGGYTQFDVEELSRAITGWTLCKKSPANLDDPLAPCIPEYWDEGVPGAITVNFVAGGHDCSSKVLFSGTPQQVTIPDTCGNPSSGAQDLFLAIDAIVAHPATAAFISGKLLEAFVTDDPDPEMISAMVAEWNDGFHPHGVGDVQALLATALDLDVFFDPNRVGSKIKTPLEQFASVFRAIRGRTDGATEVIDFLVRAQHLPHLNPTPTGWPEDGLSWIGTGNVLERQNFALALLASTDVEFRADPLAVLADNAVSTLPGNAEAIIAFFSDTLFGGALTPAERQVAIDFLNTDDLGQPAAYDDARIRDVVALLLGYSQFQEQ